MGLDMYLYKRHYVKNWEHNGPEGQYQITVNKGGKPYKAIKVERVFEITEEVAYWRKANAIHAWFVKHVQDGEDDCKSYFVSREDLEKLKAACDKVLANSKMKPAKVYAGSESKGGGPWVDIMVDGEKVVDPQVAETVLPTKKGFFFGHYDYDDGYIEDIKYTSEILDELLDEPEEYGDFEYRASW